MDNLQADKRLIFVGGPPRSGTTLLQNMLDSHPDILGGPEFLHIPDIIKLRNLLQSSISREWINLICSHDEIEKYIHSLISNTLLSFADKHGGKMYSEKTPENVLAFPELVDILPSAHFIFVVRDPRAIVASLLSVGKKARSKGETPAPYTVNVHAAIKHTIHCLNRGFKATQRAPEKIYTVVYEKLVQDPEGETKNLCQFLEIEWVPEMLKPGGKKHLGEQAITVKSKEIWYDASTYNSDPNTQSLEKWRTSMTPFQKVAICRAFRYTAGLKQLGYDLSLTGMSATARLIGMTSYILYKLWARINKYLQGVLQKTV